MIDNKSDKLIHISYNKIKKLYSTRNEQDDSDKPVALWYSNGLNWLNFFSEFEDEIKNCKYMYELKLKYTKFSTPDPKKILRIKKESTFDKFTFKYGWVKKNEFVPVAKTNTTNGTDIEIYHVNIDWKRVVDDYGGIEIIPLIKSRMSTEDTRVIKKYNEKFKFVKRVNKKKIYIYFWQGSFSVGSGCIWDPYAVKKIKRIYEI